MNMRNGGGSLVAAGSCLGAFAVLSVVVAMLMGGPEMENPLGRGDEIVLRKNISWNTGVQEGYVCEFLQGGILIVVSRMPDDSLVIRYRGESPEPAAGECRPDDFFMGADEEIRRLGSS